MPNPSSHNDEASGKVIDSTAPSLVVGIGCGAGGLDALEGFLKSVPTECGIAFIVIQHLGSEAEVEQRELISRFTPLPVQMIADASRVEPNGIYVAAPQSTVVVDQNTLRSVVLNDAKNRRTTIDTFFQSLADEYQSGAVGIVLSGAGTDGTLGLKAISDAGGMTMAQDAESAKFESMPQNAASTGVADHVLAPEAMLPELVAYVRHLQEITAQDRTTALQQRVESVLPTICSVLLEQMDHDFRHYKSSTLSRRVLRRMQVLKLASPASYVDRMRESQEESQKLFRELLIGVTSFFRDAETFAALASLVLPKLVKEHDGSDPIRIWIPGCASGEEVYTLAILLTEATGDLEAPPAIQLFGTDINERALAIARQGVYPLEIADHLSKARLKRFFIRKGNRFHLCKSIRELCTFSIHNLISDPPFPVWT